MFLVILYLFSLFLIGVIHDDEYESRGKNKTKSKIYTQEKMRGKNAFPTHGPLLMLILVRVTRPIILGSCGILIGQF